MALSGTQMLSAGVQTERQRRGETVSGVPALAEPPASFDCVLLDPPCSALGLRPRIVQTACATEMKWAVQYQRAFLWSAVRMLRAGGVLVYSTCTITPAENEAQVSAL